LCCLVNDGKVSSKFEFAQVKKHVVQPIFLTYCIEYNITSTPLLPTLNTINI